MYRIWGYITTFERNSKKLKKYGLIGGFYERVERGAFHKSICSTRDIPLVLNHDENIVLARTINGTLTLSEDWIGLKFDATITDSSIIRDIQIGKINGCSFKFKSVNETIIQDTYPPVRVLQDVRLDHVSLIRSPKEPAYIGTIVHYIGEA